MKPAFDISQTWLECMICGNKVDLLKEKKFICENCGGLFDVNHDFSDIIIDTQAFTNRKARCRRNNENYDQSGVWRYRELIMPHLPVENIVSLAEGNVPIVHAGRNLCKWVGTDNLWIILEGMTPTGSFKDFGMTVLISLAKAAGVQAVLCGSTGDTVAAAAAYAAAAGIKCAGIVPEGKITAVQGVHPGMHGALMIAIRGTFDDCMKITLELVSKYGVYPANSLNPARIEGHQATSFQIAHFFDWQMPDWIVVPVGNGSNCSSVGKGIRLIKRLSLVKRGSRILGCQSRAACPLAKSWHNRLTTPAEWLEIYRPMDVGETTATAARIGHPVSAKKVMREIISSDGAMQIAEEAYLNEAVAVCGLDGIFVCPQTGIALAGLREAVLSRTVKKDETVVAVSTATGLKFTESASKHLGENIIHLDNCKADSVARILQL